MEIGGIGPYWRSDSAFSVFFLMEIRVGQGQNVVWTGVNAGRIRMKKSYSGALGEV